MEHIKRTIVSVEKYQGSDRDYIIASIGLSDLDQLAAEEEFIYDINRYNVLTSRPKRKLTIICSEKFLNYVPKDREIMEKSEIIRNYCFNYCQNEKIFTFSHKKPHFIKYRWK